MQRVCVQLLCVGHLHYLAHVHHRHAVGDVLDHAQVMGDEYVGQIKVRLQVLQQVQRLRLNGHVEGGYRFVTDDEARIQGQRTGNADALPLAAGKLVGIATHMFRAQANVFEELDDGLFGLGSGALAVNHHRLAYNLEYAHSRVQGANRVLKDHGHFLPDRFHLLLIQIQQVHHLGLTVR